MVFHESIDGYLSIFFYLGQSPCLTTHTSGQCKNSCYIYLFANTSLSIALSLFCIYMINLVCQVDWSHTDRVIINIISLCEIIRVSSMLLQSLLFKEDFVKVIRTFRRLERFYVIYLSHSIAYGKFKRSYSIKFLIIVVAYVPQLAFFVHKSVIHVGSHRVGLPSKCLQLLKLIYIFYNMFYVDMLNFYLAQLSCIIRKDITNEVACSNTYVLSQGSVGVTLMREKLKLYKMAHFQLWEAGRQISNLFGWSMIATAVYGFVEFVYAAYHAVVVLHPPWHMLRIMGKIIIINGLE